MSDGSTPVRAYFHWKNRTGRQPDDAVSNWTEAQDDEVFLASLPGRIRWPYCVVDQNRLRNAMVLAPENGPFLLPDVAVAELFKSDAWRYVAERSLALISQTPDLVVLSHAVGAIFNDELATGHLGDVIDPVGTATFREFLRRVAVDPAAAFSLYSSSIEAARVIGISQHFDGLRNKATVTNVRDAWLQELTKEQIRTLRGPDGANSPLFLELVSDSSMLRTVTDMLCNAGYPTPIAQSLAFYPSFTGAHCVGLVALALQWIARGGLDGTTNEDVLTNDLADIDYVVLSIFCRSYASTERKMLSLRQTLLTALESGWRRNAEWLLEEHKLQAGKPV